MIPFYGRGASAESMLGLAEVFAQPDVAYLAPQAPGGSWYPYSFLAPIDQNEPPQLSKSLSRNSADKGSARSGWPCSASRKAAVSPWSSRPPTRGATAPSLA